MMAAGFLAFGALPALAQGLPEPACWFFVYRWSQSESTGGTGNFHLYVVSGIGTAMMVTEGGEPTRAQKTEAENRIAASLPHHPGLPPSVAAVTKVTPVVCPRDWPSIPGVPPNLLGHPRY